MISQKRGHIVTIASVAGLCGVAGLSDYCASKFGAVGLDSSVRYELIHKGVDKYVKTTCICPYFIDTGMFDGAKPSFPLYFLKPERVADRVVAAIRQEEALVVIPYRANVVFLCKLLPTGLQDLVGDWLGVTKAMENFKGRGSIEKRIPGILSE